MVFVCWRGVPPVAPLETRQRDRAPCHGRGGAGDETARCIRSSGTLAALATETGQAVRVENPRHQARSLSALHEKIARRRDFLHKTTTALVSVLAFIATGVLAVTNMTAGGRCHR